jgi:hypothetical protein
MLEPFWSIWAFELKKPFASGLSTRVGNLLEGTEASGPPSSTPFAKQAAAFFNPVDCEGNPARYSWIDGREDGATNSIG